MRRITQLVSMVLALGATDARAGEAARSEPSDAGWTVLVYGAVDNDWERPFMRDVRRMRRGLEHVPELDVVLLIDRSPSHSDDAAALGEDFAATRLYRLTGGSAEHLDGTPEFPGLSIDASTELNTGDVSTLRSFIRYGKRRFPARHYALFLVSHGEGMRCCPDETDGGDELFTAEFTDRLSAEESVDLLVFDACLMAGAENAYQWRPGAERFGADHLVAAAPVSSSLPYADIFARLRTDTSTTDEGEALSVRRRVTFDPATLRPRGFATLLVEELEHQIREGRSGDEGLERDLQSWGAFDLSKVEGAKRALDRLASRLFVEHEKADLMALRGKGLEADTFVYVWPERDAALSMPNVDLCHLCERIAASEAFSDETRDLAARAAEAAAEVVVSSVGFDHYEGFVAGRHGLYLIFPDGDAKTRGGDTYWQRTDWYTPRAVDGENAYGRYAWCRDGAVPANGEVENWFELMDAWFDTNDADGGSNGYRF